MVRSASSPGRDHTTQAYVAESRAFLGCGRQFYKNRIYVVTRRKRHQGNSHTTRCARGSATGRDASTTYDRDVRGLPGRTTTPGIANGTRYLSPVHEDVNSSRPPAHPVPPDPPHRHARGAPTVGDGRGGRHRVRRGERGVELGAPEADQGGALQEVRDAPFGEVLLWGAVVGFLALAVFQLLDGLVRGGELTDRVKALSRAALYAVLGDLPETLREAFILRDLEQIPAKDVADANRVYDALSKGGFSPFSA